MTTHWIRAELITTDDSVVTGGENNPLQPGGKRRAWKVSEVQNHGPLDGTTLRMVCRGCDKNGGDAWITQTFENKLKLRVLTR